MELHTGHHLIYQLFGMNVNMDTLYMTWLTAAIVIIITLAATRGRSLVPSGIQNAVELTDNKSLCQSIRAWLYGIRQMHSKLMSVA